MRGIVGIAAHVMAVVVALAVWAPQGDGQTYAQTADPLEVLQGYIDAVNAGDAATMAASFAEDGYLVDIDGGGFGVFGMAALQFGFAESEGTEGTQITIASSQVSGDTVTGKAEIVDPGSVAAGVDRYVQPFVAVTSAGKIASLVTHYDETDEQTVQYLEHALSQEEGGGEDEPDPESVQLSMGGDQAGEAGLNEFAPGVTGIFVGIAEGPDGVEQPSAVRSGTCGDLGEVVQGLAPVVSGAGGSIVSMSLADLLASPHALTVSESPDSADIIASCANIARSADAGGPELPPTGTGISDDSSAMTWLIASLALVGMGGVAGASVVARRR